MGVQNPSPSQLLAFSLLLVDLPARRHKLGCLSLSVLIFARASASRLADLRALAPIGARGLILSPIDHSPLSRLVSLSYPESKQEGKEEEKEEAKDGGRERKKAM